MAEAWVKKPNGEQDTTPEPSSHRMGKQMISDSQSQDSQWTSIRLDQLMQMGQRWDKEKDLWDNSFTTDDDRDNAHSSPGSAICSARSAFSSTDMQRIQQDTIHKTSSIAEKTLLDIDDGPIPIFFPALSAEKPVLPTAKRRRGNDRVLSSQHKKARFQGVASSNGCDPEFRASSGQVEFQARTISKLTKPDTFSTKALSASDEALTDVESSPFFTSHARVQYERERLVNISRTDSMINTSFISDASLLDSIIDSAPSTQLTVPDKDVESVSSIPVDLPALKPIEPFFTDTRETEQRSSSDYASSSFERKFGHLAESDIIQPDETKGQLIQVPSDSSSQELSQELGALAFHESHPKCPVDHLRISLCSVFPALPDILIKLPYYVVYEITRVFLHAEVSLSKLSTPLPSSVEDYDSFWQFLKSLAPLQGKPFPERCGKHVWNCARKGYQQGVYSVVFSGTLKFTSNPRQLFRLLLAPLKMDKGHRAGRRFGHDRFLEITIPNVRGFELPQVLRDVGEEGLSQICEWLIDEQHYFLFREWKAFDTKQIKSDRSNKKHLKQISANASPKAAVEKAEAMHKISFFSVKSPLFRSRGDFDPANIEQPHADMSIADFFDKIRPTAENLAQPYTKLFARTQLALSRTSATIQIEQRLVRYRNDLTYGPRDEIMNDGAGRISYSLALQITHALGLSYQPTAFQARFGEAKGMWIVDPIDRDADDWIEVYPSQQKWNQNPSRNGRLRDRSHQWFEVVRYSGPLKSADLNVQFLPILLENAKNQEVMRRALGQAMKAGLQHKFEVLQSALSDPQLFRKWLRESYSNSAERVKAGIVSYRAGMPSKREEKLNVMLDAGFDPLALNYMKDMTRKLLVEVGDQLKEKLNITVGKSAYVYMVPDFWGVLEANEVYLDFSSFTDATNDFTSAIMQGTELLVARSPAHFISDIQKVRTVRKIELQGLKDVIVFPVKGNPSLAAKLSGGDYDGDMAWVCWQPSVVNNFKNSNIPRLPDLEKEGFTRKDKTTYGEVVAGESSEKGVSLWLKKAFEFNLRPSLLGRCTVHKEKLCIALGGLNNEKAIYMSQLLSDLVDQAKQGTIFEEEDWLRLKQKKNLNMVKDPDYLTHMESKRSSYIVDYLKWVAKDTVDQFLTKFHTHCQNRQPPASDYDNDLVYLAKEARQNAKRFADYRTLLDGLDANIAKLKASWQAKFAGGGDADFDGGNMEFIIETHDKFQEIKPTEDNALTASLLPRNINSGVSPWALLKASVVFASYTAGYVQKFPWWVAGRQLLYLKAFFMKSRGTPHVIIPSMFIILKPDVSMIRQIHGQSHVSDEAACIVNTDGLDEAES